MHINMTNLAIFSEKNSLQHLETIKSVFQTIVIALALALALALTLALALANLLGYRKYGGKRGKKISANAKAGAA